jgi:hypothetical protein
MSQPGDRAPQSAGEMGSGHEVYENLGERPATVEVARPEDSEDIVRLLTTEKYNGYKTQQLFVIRDADGRIIGTALAGVFPQVTELAGDEQSADRERYGAILDMVAEPGATAQALTEACHAWFEQQGAGLLRRRTRGRDEQGRRIPSATETAAILSIKPKRTSNTAMFNPQTGQVYPDDGSYRPL